MYTLITAVRKDEFSRGLLLLSSFKRHHDKIIVYGLGLNKSMILALEKFGAEYIDMIDIWPDASRKFSIRKISTIKHAMTCYENVLFCGWNTMIFGRCDELFEFNFGTTISFNRICHIPYTASNADFIAAKKRRGTIEFLSWLESAMFHFGGQVFPLLGQHLRDFPVSRKDINLKIDLCCLSSLASQFEPYKSSIYGNRPFLVTYRSHELGLVDAWIYNMPVTDHLNDMLVSIEKDNVKMINFRENENIYNQMLAKVYSGRKTGIISNCVTI